MKKAVLFLLSAGCVFSQELLVGGKLLTGVEIGQKSEPLPLLIELEGLECTVYAVAVPGDAKRVWIKPEKLYCKEKVEKVRGFVTDKEGVLGLACSSIPCPLEKGTQVKVFLERKRETENLPVTKREKDCLSKVPANLYALKTYTPYWADVQMNLMKMLVSRGADVCRAFESVTGISLKQKRNAADAAEKFAEEWKEAVKR